MPDAERGALLRAIRPRWTPLPAPGDGGPPAWLRWQGMNDAPLRSRLASAIAVEDWRSFSNGLLDRRAPGEGRRLRGREDYRPLERWRRGDRVAGAAISERLPAHINFELLP